MKGNDVYQLFGKHNCVTVEHAALFLQCSTRRVRYLLSHGRLSGFKDEMRATRPWKVIWPLVLTPGSRGPDMRRLPTRLPKLLRRNSTKSTLTDRKAG